MRGCCHASFRDLSRLQEIERQAGEVFRHVGMNAVAGDEPLCLELLRGYVDRGQAWVIADHADVSVAYLLADVVDGAGHVEQVSVIAGHARQGLSRVLLAILCVPNSDVDLEFWLTLTPRWCSLDSGPHLAPTLDA
jgi:hypothetical protein